MMFLRRKKRKKFFVLRKAANLLTVKGRRTLILGDEEFYVFKCGENTVVYKRDQEFFNSAKEGIPYSEWLKQYKIKKGIVSK